MTIIKRKRNEKDTILYAHNGRKPRYGFSPAGQALYTSRTEPSRRLSKVHQSDTLTIADMQWWEIYTDTTLQQLISKTLDHNKDLLISAARVKELAALKRIDWANLFPRIDAKAYMEKEAAM